MEIKTKELVAAAEDLQEILKFDDEPMDTTLPDDKLIDQIKKAALWLFASDEVKPETVEVLKVLDWSKEDLENLEEPKEQDPLPAFRRYGILVEEKEKVEKPKSKRVPRKSAAEKKKAQAPTKTVAEKKIARHVTAAAKPATRPVEIDEPQEFTDGRPPKVPSAYGTALALMGPDPDLPVPELYDMMRAKGFDIIKNHGSIKTAHSIFTKCYRYLKEHGHIKE